MDWCVFVVRVTIYLKVKIANYKNPRSNAQTGNSYENVIKTSPRSSLFFTKPQMLKTKGIFCQLCHDDFQIIPAHLIF